MTDLNAAMLAAHATSDQKALVALYTQAADQAVDLDAACFFLTHAYVFALELGHTQTEALRLRLVAEGREPA